MQEAHEQTAQVAPLTTANPWAADVDDAHAPQSPAAAPRTVVIDVQGANVTGIERARPWFVVLGVAFLSLLSVGLAMAFLPLAIATFLAVIGTLIELAGRSFPRTDWAWRAALAMGTLSACGLAYLLLDRASLIGFGRARRILLTKAERVLPGGPPADRFFVLLNAETPPGPGRRRPGALEDIGWLFVYPDRLRYVGDRALVSIPRDAVGPQLQRGPNLSWVGLGGPTLALPLVVREKPSAPAGNLRFQSRDADTISGTSDTVKPLEAALRAWLRDPAPAPADASEG